MRQIWIPQIGDPDVLEIREAPDPMPGPGQVRVQVAAAGVNFADLMARMGLYPDCPPLPVVVGYEVSGTIDAVGDDVQTSRIGEEVIAICKFGGYSSAIVVDDLQAIPLPDGKDLITGAALPVTGITSWMMLEVMGRVREGDRVLVHSAGGGVGLMALDMLKWRGAYAVGTASAAKHDLLYERGYNELIDYRTEDFEAALCDAEGFDLILDPVGGDSWAKGLRLLRAGGRMVMFGMSSNASGRTNRSIFGALSNLAAVPWLKMNPITLINENKGVMGVNMGHLWDEGDRVAGWMRSVVGLWAEDIVHPLVHATVPFDQAHEAHQILHDRKNIGKVLLIP